MKSKEWRWNEFSILFIFLLSSFSSSFLSTRSSYFLLLCTKLRLPLCVFYYLFCGIPYAPAAPLLLLKIDTIGKVFLGF